ncbi:uncharacterized protein [Argopecten irradians]|uniref:uncharacterized protein n=1 Tax=Argopecten irradians TaxID=31199 RepID=UPI003719C109
MSILTSKWSNLYPCGQAARPCSKVILLTQNLTNGQTGVISVAVTDKSGLYYGQNDLPLFMVSSFDGGVSWEIRTAWRRTVENYPCVCCDLPSCPTHLVAVSCDQWPYLPLRLKGHWESWTIDSSSYNLQTVFPKLSISFDSGSIEDRASIFLILEQTDFLPTVHFLSSEDFILPITLKFSCTGSESDLPRKVFVLMQDGDLKWSRKETITIIPEIGELKIQVQNIKKGVRRAIAVVPSDLNSFSMSVFGIKRYNGMLNYSSHRLINELLNSTSTDNNG